jgi:hypothetical protein
LKKITNVAQDTVVKIPGDTTNDESYEDLDPLKDTSTSIKFPEFMVTINRLVEYDTAGEMKEIQKDTAYVEAEVGENIEGQQLTINSDLLNDLKVEQRYETSVTIMDEGPHCDLTNWKHYYSDWHRLNSIGAGKYTCEKYTEQERQKFPGVSIQELRNAVAKHCGKEWTGFVSKVKSPTDYPSGVSISNYFLRISGIRKDNGRKIVKVIVIESPMGC